MPFNDPNNTHNPITDAAAPAAWGDAIRDDLMALAGSPRVRVALTTTQSIPDGALTAVLFDGEHFDSHGMHSNASNTSRLTVPANWFGEYLIGACVQWQTNTDSTNRRHAQIRRNGTDKLVDDERPPDSAGYATQNLLTMFSLAPGDYVELLVYQNTGVPVSVQSDGWAGTVLWAKWLNHHEIIG